MDVAPAPDSVQQEQNGSSLRSKSNTTSTPSPPIPQFGLPLVNNRYNPSKFPFEFTEQEFSLQLTTNQRYITELQSTFYRYFSGYPLLNLNTNIPAMVTKLVDTNYEDDFVLSGCWNPHFIVALFYYGFLPIAEGYPHTSPTHEYKYVWLLPKLHKKRCVIDWKKYTLPHSIPRQSDQMYLSMNSAFDAVVAGCIRQHSDAWLYPCYREVLNEIFQNNDNRWFVRLHSIEIWMKKDDILRLKNIHLQLESTKHVETTPDADSLLDSDSHQELEQTLQNRAQKFAEKQKATIARGFLCQTPSEDNPIYVPSLSTQFGNEYYLVAGEIGFSVNDTLFCSLTGFRNSYIDSCGTVQLHALAMLLRNAGIEVWDLGMCMEYKKKLGAVEIPRKKFVSYIEKQRQICENQHTAENGNEHDNQKEIDQCSEDTKDVSGPGTHTDSTSQLYSPKHPCRIEKTYISQILKNKAKYDEQINLEEKKIKTQREKKLRWLIKKHGENDSIVTEYKEFIRTGKMVHKNIHSDPEDKNLQNQIESKQDAAALTISQETLPLHPFVPSNSSANINPLLLCNLVPCRSLFGLESNIKDDKWVDLKPTAATLAKRRAAAAAAAVEVTKQQTVVETEVGNVLTSIEKEKQLHD